MPDSSREWILQRVTNGLKTARLPAASGADVPLSELESASPEELIERFQQELKKLGVAYFWESDEAAARFRVRSLIRGKRLLAWDPESLPFQVASIFEREKWMRNDAPREEREQADVGVTGVDAAIAETGTLALLSSSAHPRTASLLPPTHLAIVRTNQILSTMRVFFERFGKAITASSCLNLITGPSRTADIELQLTLGVHGPGEVIVVMA